MLWKQVIFSIILEMVIVAHAFSAARQDIKVAGNDAVLRASPSDGAEVVCTLSAGDVLTAEKGLDYDWVEVLPPHGLDLWMYSELVMDGQVVGPKAAIRAKPDTASKAVFKVEKGESVTVRGAQGEWLKIAPPRNFTLWIPKRNIETDANRDKKAVSRDRVTKSAGETAEGATVAGENGNGADGPDGSGGTGKKFVSGKKKTARTDSYNTEEHGSFLGSRLVSFLPQKQNVVVKGTLRKSPLVWGRPSRYQLVGVDSRGRAVGVCYIRENIADLGTYDGRILRVVGRKYWLQGSRHPVVDAEQVYAE